MERTVIRGDSYVTRRQVYRLTLVDDAMEPFDLTGCTVRSTFRPQPSAPIEDPDDEAAALAVSIRFGNDGQVVTAETNGLALPPDHTAADGLLDLTADSAATLALPLGVALRSDVQVTDTNGERLTVIMPGTLKAIDAYTHR